MLDWIDIYWTVNKDGTKTGMISKKLLRGKKDIDFNKVFKWGDFYNEDFTEKKEVFNQFVIDYGLPQNLIKS
jgi:hypothetical protein